MAETTPPVPASRSHITRAATATIASLAALVLSAVQAQPEGDLVLRVTTPASRAVDALVYDNDAMELPAGTSELRVDVVGGTGGAHVFVFELDGEAVATIDASKHVAIELPIMSGEDDAEEFKNASRRNPTTWPASFTFVTSSDLELGDDPTHGDQLVALRFPDLGVPRGARILRAEAVFVADGASTGGSVSLMITGERSSAAAPFEEDPDGVGRGGLSRRLRTETAVPWMIDEPWRAGARYATPELGPIMQEVVDLDGWDVDSALVLFFETDHPSAAYRRAYSFEGAGGDPALVTRLFLAYETVPVDGYSVKIEVPLGTSELTVTAYVRSEFQHVPAGTIRVAFIVGSAQEPAPAPEAQPDPGAPQPEPKQHLPAPDPTPTTVTRSTTVTQVTRLPVRAISSSIVLGDVDLTAFDDATSSLTLRWRRQRSTALSAGVYVGSCTAPQELVLELRPLEPSEAASETRVPVAGSALRYGGFAVVFRDSSGAGVGCVSLAE